LRHFLDAGVTFFLDLTVEGESGLRPYAPLLPRKTLRAGAPVHYQRMAIRDMSTPTLPLLQQILTTLDGALAGGHTVYVHCWAGIGRTGTVIGCYLVQQGMSPSQAFQTIAHLLQNTPRSHRRSPETEAQRQVVQQWAQHYHGVAQPNEEADS
jgi:protein-tyrosine phosphatase